MTTNAPVYGIDHIWKSNMKFYIRMSDDKISKPASITAAETTLEGTKFVADVTCEADSEDSLDGDYFKLTTPSNLYVFWYSTSGGSAVAPSITGATETVEIDIDTDETASEVARKTELVMEDYSDFTVVRSDDDLTITGKQGGVCDGISDGDTGWSVFTNTTPGVGAWAKFGKIKNDATFGLEDDAMVTDTENSDIKLNKKLGAEFILMNVHGRSWDIIRTYYMNESVDIALLDTQNGNVFIYYNVILDADLNPFGDSGEIPMTASTGYSVNNLKGTTPNIVMYSYVV